MTRHVARAGLVAGALLITAMAALVSTAALTSGRVPLHGEVAIASAAALDADAPTPVEAPLLVGLDDKAWRARSGDSTHIGLIGVVRPSRLQALPIYVVRRGDGVHAFIAIDPRNGCDLRVRPVQTSSSGPTTTVFYDVCHGSLYDLGGNIRGGPTPWTLDQLVVTVHDGLVYAAAGVVVPGRLARP